MTFTPEIREHYHTRQFISRGQYRMMAFDRTPSLPNLDPQTIERLRAALSRAASEGNHADDLRELLCATAEEARAKGIQAERLLIVLKDLWYSLPQASGSALQSQNELLQELVSRCIQEYYAL